jgi:hypothetical protein
MAGPARPGDFQKDKTVFTIGDTKMARAFGASETLLAGPDLVSVTDTTDGDSLETLLGKPVYGSLTRLALYPSAAGIFFASGAASAASGPLPAGGIDLPIRKDEADLLRFVVDGDDVGMTVIQIG